MKKFHINLEEVNQILAYLGRCPYADVYKLMSMITALKPLEEKGRENGHNAETNPSEAQPAAQ